MGVAGEEGTYLSVVVVVLAEANEVVPIYFRRCFSFMCVFSNIRAQI